MPCPPLARNLLLDCESPMDVHVPRSDWSRSRSAGPRSGSGGCLRGRTRVQTQKRQFVDNLGSNLPSAELHRCTTAVGLQERIPMLDCCFVLEIRRDSDPGTRTSRSPQNPAGHWIGSFATP